MISKLGSFAACATIANGISLMQAFQAIERHIIGTSDGDYGMRDVLVTNDDNGVVDESVTVTRDDAGQDDGTCELMLHEEEDDNGGVRNVYVSDCTDLEAKDYKQEFEKATTKVDEEEEKKVQDRLHQVMEKTRVMNAAYTQPLKGRTKFTLGGKSFRK